MTATTKQTWRERGLTRPRFQFWFRARNPKEAELADYCEQLHEQRLFNPTIRDGLELIRDLRQQRLDVLFRLFPWVNAYIEERAEAIALNNAMLHRRLETLERLVQSSTSALPSGIPAYVYEEETRPSEPVTAEIDRGDSNPAFDMLISTSAFTGNYQKLPDEVRAYGVRKGTVPAEFAPVEQPTQEAMAVPVATEPELQSESEPAKAKVKASKPRPQFNFAVTKVSHDTEPIVAEEDTRMMESIEQPTQPTLPFVDEDVTVDVI